MKDDGIRFYAGAPLVSAGGHAVGTLCVMDRRPRTLSDAQAAALRALSRQVVAQLELRRTMEVERAEAGEVIHERDEAFRIVASELPGVFWTTDRDLRFTASIGAGRKALARRRHPRNQSSPTSGRPTRSSCRSRPTAVRSRASR